MAKVSVYLKVEIFDGLLIFRVVLNFLGLVDDNLLAKSS